MERKKVMMQDLAGAPGEEKVSGIDVSYISLLQNLKLLWKLMKLKITIQSRLWFYLQIKLLLSVVRAYDVPVRCDMDPLQSQSNLQIQVTNEK